MQLKRVLIDQQVGNKRTQINLWACAGKRQDINQISVVKAGTLSLGNSQNTMAAGLTFLMQMSVLPLALRSTSATVTKWRALK